MKKQNFSSSGFKKQVISRKGQITLAILAGLVIVVLLALLALNNGPKKAQLQESSINSKELSLASSQMDSIIQNCLDQALAESIDDYGLHKASESAMANAVRLKTGTCLKNVFDQTMLNKEGFNLDQGFGTVVVSINDDMVMAEMDVPISISFNGEKASFNKYTSKALLSDSFDIPNNNGVVSKDVVITFDKIKLNIPKGTKVTDKQGNPLNKLVIKKIDRYDGRGFYGSKPIVGMVFYEVSDAVFDPPIEVEVEIEEKDLPETGIGTVVFGYYDEAGMFRGWRPKSRETFQKNGKTYYKIVSDVYHFTKVGPVSCSDMAIEVDPNTGRDNNGDIPPREITTFDLEVQTPNLLPVKKMFQTPCGTLEWDPSSNGVEGTCFDYGWNGYFWKLRTDTWEAYVPSPHPVAIKDDINDENYERAKLVFSIVPYDYPEGMLPAGECVLKDYDGDDQTDEVSVAFYDSGSPVDDDSYYDKLYTSDDSLSREQKKESALAQCKDLYKQMLSEYFNRNVLGYFYNTYLKDSSVMHDGFIDGAELTCEIDGSGNVVALKKLEEVAATPPTFGYKMYDPSNNKVFGVGKYDFYISENNDACVMDYDGDANADISLLNPAIISPVIDGSYLKYFSVNKEWTYQDNFMSVLENHVLPQVLYPDASLDLSQDKVIGPEDSGDELKKGTNSLYAMFSPFSEAKINEIKSAIDNKVDMSDPTNHIDIVGCFAGYAGLEIKGINVQDARVTTENDCTIQDRINFLVNNGIGLSEPEIAMLAEKRSFLGKDAKLSDPNLGYFENDFPKVDPKKVPRGCGKEEFDALSVIGKDKCDYGKVGWYCEGDLFYKCNGLPGGLMDAGMCPRDTDKEGDIYCTTDALHTMYDCISSQESVGCVDLENGNPITHTNENNGLCSDDEPNKYYVCKSGIKQGPFECPENKLCHQITKDTYECTDNECKIRFNGQEGYYCRDPNTEVHCDASGNPVTKDCAVSFNSYCYYPTGKCQGYDLNIYGQEVCNGKDDGTFYCLDRGLSGEYFKCVDDGNGNMIAEYFDTTTGNPLYVCPENQVCLNEGGTDSDKVCGENPLYSDMMCSGKQDGWYCEAAHLSPAVVQCSNEKASGREFCDEKCYNDGSASKKDACAKPYSETEYDDLCGIYGWDGNYHCASSSFGAKVVLCGTDHEVSTDECTDNTVCIEPSSPSSDKNDYCKSPAEQADYLCNPGGSGKQLGPGVFCSADDDANVYSCNYFNGAYTLEVIPCREGTHCYSSSGYEKKDSVEAACTPPSAAEQGSECSRYGLDADSSTDKPRVKCVAPSRQGTGYYYCNDDGTVEIREGGLCFNDDSGKAVVDSYGVPVDGNKYCSPSELGFSGGLVKVGDDYCEKGDHIKYYTCYNSGFVEEGLDAGVKWRVICYNDGSNIELVPGCYEKDYGYLVDTTTWTTNPLSSNTNIYHVGDTFCCEREDNKDCYEDDLDNKVRSHFLFECKKDSSSGYGYWEKTGICKPVSLVCSADFPDLCKDPASCNSAFTDGLNHWDGTQCLSSEYGRDAASCNSVFSDGLNHWDGSQCQAHQVWH